MPTPRPNGNTDAEPMSRISYAMPEDLIAAVRRVAAGQDRSASYIVRRALLAYPAVRRALEEQQPTSPVAA